jgi:hypothetical protein
MIPRIVGERGKIGKEVAASCPIVTRQVLDIPPGSRRFD